MATHQFILRIAINNAFKNGSFGNQLVMTTSKTGQPADNTFVALDVTWKGNRGKVWQEAIGMTILERVDPIVSKLGVIIKGEHLGMLVKVLRHSKDKKFAMVEEIEGCKGRFKVAKDALNSIKEW